MHDQSQRIHRLAANQRYQSAADLLDQVSIDLDSPRGESARLLDQVRGAMADLEQAERMAREDIQLAQQAMAELAEARRAIDGSRSYFAMGVGAEARADRFANGNRLCELCRPRASQNQGKVGELVGAFPP